MESVDLVIVGAGLWGLVVAKTYLQVNPAASIIILETSTTLGGTWSPDRLYPGLKTNNQLGTFEFSDFPLTDFGVKAGEHLPGEVVFAYLNAYAGKFDLLRRIRCNSRVKTAEHLENNRWRLTIDSGSHCTIEATKMVIATGLTSQPFIPTLPGSADFGGELFHSKDLGKHADDLKSCKQVVVLGGSKSAWDVAYEYANAGVEVNWIIKESGHGPGWVARPFATPFKIWMEMLITTRFCTWFSPCIWGDADTSGGMVRDFLHRSWLGRKITDAYFSIVSNDVLTGMGFDSHPEAKKLKPRYSIFWAGTNLSIYNYEKDFFEFIRNGLIKVHVADVMHLSKGAVHLTSTTALPADTVVLCTGWDVKPHIEFLPKGIEASLGLPCQPSTKPQPSLSVLQAGHQILKQFPRLIDGPDSVKLPENKMTQNPYRLYRFMIPPAFLHERSIAFAGALGAISTTLIAQTQALWITAYFGGSLNHLKHTGAEFDEKITHEAILHSEYSVLRHRLGPGLKHPDMSFEGLPYIDLMLRELGLASHRKGSWWKEWFTPYRTSDYEGLVDEWVQQNNDMTSAEPKKTR